MWIGGLGIASFGLTLPITRFVVTRAESVGGIAVSGVFVGLGRAVFGALLALVVLLVVRPGFPTRSQLGRLVLVALGVVVGFPMLASVAMQTVPASHGAVVLGILPLVTALAGVVVAGERPSPGFWGFGLLGAGLVVGFSLSAGGGSLQLGDLALGGAILFAAMGYSVGGKLARELGGWLVISWALVLALPFVSVPMLWLVPDGWRGASPGVWAGFAYLCFVSQYLGFFLWYRGLALGGIARVSQVQLLQPFVTFAVAAWFFGEHLGPSALMALAGVSVVVVLGRRMPVRSAVQAAGRPE